MTGLQRRPDFEVGRWRGLRQSDWRLCGIEVEVSNSSDANELADFLRGLCFDVRLLEEGRLEARFREPLPANRAAAQLELDLYLRVWQAIHPEAWAVRVT